MNSSSNNEVSALFQPISVDIGQCVQTLQQRLHPHVKLAALDYQTVVLCIWAMEVCGFLL